MHPYTIKAASLPRLFTRTSKVYLLLTSHTSPWLNSHTCILKHFGAPKIAHVHILAFLIPIYTQTSWWILTIYTIRCYISCSFFKFLLPKAACKFKHIFLCWLKLHSNLKGIFFVICFLHITCNIFIYIFCETFLTTKNYIYIHSSILLFIPKVQIAKGILLPILNLHIHDEHNS